MANLNIDEKRLTALREDCVLAWAYATAALARAKECGDVRLRELLIHTERVAWSAYRKVRRLGARPRRPPGTGGATP